MHETNRASCDMVIVGAVISRRNVTADYLELNLEFSMAASADSTIEERGLEVIIVVISKCPAKRRTFCKILVISVVTSLILLIANNI